MLLALVFEIITFLLHRQCYTSRAFILNITFWYLILNSLEWIFMYNFFFLSIKIHELIPELKMIENS